MENSQIDKELHLIRLKIKLLITLKYYFTNTNQTELSFFYRILDLLKQKYNDANDFNFIEQGIRCNLQNYNNLTSVISYISSYIINYNNESLLKDLLNSIDTGINYKLENNHEIIETLIIENTNISIEQNNTLQRIEENTNNL
jgi:hypothetical protein